MKADVSFRQCSGQYPETTVSVDWCYSNNLRYVDQPPMNGISSRPRSSARLPALRCCTSQVMLSILASQGYAVEQVDAFFQKPFVPAILANRVRELLP